MSDLCGVRLAQFDRRDFVFVLATHLHVEAIVDEEDAGLWHLLWALELQLQVKSLGNSTQPLLDPWQR